MFIYCPNCDQKYEVKPEHIGSTVKCSVCDETFEIKNIMPPQPPQQELLQQQKFAPPPQQGLPQQEKFAPPPQPPPPAQTQFSSFRNQAPKLKEYKVLTQKDRWFSGKFDPELLENALNAYAAQGWRVVSAATATFPAFIGGAREEMIVILERDQ